MTIKKIIKKIINDNFLGDLYLKYKDITETIRWEKSGSLVPPPHYIKYKVIEENAKKNSINIFIESGTYYGDMLWRIKKIFKKIYSIELDNNLYQEAKKRFSKFKYINIIQGDSGLKIKEILTNIDEPSLIWLDGHYSGGVTSKGKLNTPILKELDAIIHHPVNDHIILIDDARCFNGSNDYPTIEELKNIFKNANKKITFRIVNDIILITKWKD